MPTRRQLVTFALWGAAGAAAAGFAFAKMGGGSSYEHKTMTVAEMTAPGVLLVDIRTPPEWTETGVIDGAALVEFRGAERFLKTVGPALEDGRDLVLICRSGNRTQAAARALSGRIPNKIISVEGGMKRVIAAGYQPVKPQR